MITSLLEEELQELKEKSLLRTIRSFDNIRGTRGSFLGKDILLFCGNDYLGLSQHPRVIKKAQEALEKYGVGSGAARLISGTSPAHQKLEEKIAAFKGKPRALLYSTGYMANMGILTALANKRDFILLDKLCHASIIDGAKLSGAHVRVFPHKNYERCAELLSQAKGFRKKILVSESVFSMDGDLADIQTLINIKNEYDAILIIDDAHGTGVLGSAGRGALEDNRLSHEVDIIMGTLSKALGCLGGYVASDSTTIEYLINVSRPFIFATSLPPLLCAAAYEALCVIEEEPKMREVLWQNAHALHKGLSAMGFQMNPLQSPILPVLLGAEKRALHFSNELFKQGILVPAIRTPTVPKGKARLRVTASAIHTKEDLERLLVVISQVKAEGFGRT